MNDLEVFRSARPVVTPLDDATADAIHRAVFGVGQLTWTTPRPWQRLAAMAACVATLAAVLVAIVSVRRGEGTNHRVGHDG